MTDPAPLQELVQAVGELKEAVLFVGTIIALSSVLISAAISLVFRDSKR